jgi:hypothetical protein
VLINRWKALFVLFRFYVTFNALYSSPYIVIYYALHPQFRFIPDAPCTLVTRYCAYGSRGCTGTCTLLRFLIVRDSDRKIIGAYF